MTPPAHLGNRRSLACTAGALLSLAVGACSVSPDPLGLQPPDSGVLPPDAPLLQTDVPVTPPKHAPAQHRSVAEACAQLGTNLGSDGGADGEADAIGSDAGSGSHPTGCTTDDQCGATDVCACDITCQRPFQTGGNICLKAECRTDGDCGPAGYCSLSLVPGAGNCDGFGAHITGYFCHAANDGCRDNTDCAPLGIHMNYCLYSPGAKAWTCGGGP